MLQDIPLFSKTFLSLGNGANYLDLLLCRPEHGLSFLCSPYQHASAALFASWASFYHRKGHYDQHYNHCVKQQSFLVGVPGDKKMYQPQNWDIWKKKTEQINIRTTSIPSPRAFDKLGEGLILGHCTTSISFSLQKNTHKTFLRKINLPNSSKTTLVNNTSKKLARANWFWRHLPW